MKTEIRHRRRIGRTFAISAHEVTVAQLPGVPSLADHAYNRQYSREEDAPVNTVTWYQAAQYCNWLSEQEGLPEGAMVLRSVTAVCRRHATLDDYLHGRAIDCRPKQSGSTPVAPGQLRPAHMVKRQCYWEITLGTSRNSQERWMLPVGSLMPNDFGLFDMLGNALEWCQDKPLPYGTDRPLVEDLEQTGQVRDNKAACCVAGRSLSRTLRAVGQPRLRSAGLPCLHLRVPRGEDLPLICFTP